MRPYSKSEFGPSLTKQSFKNECNINNIVARYKQTGVVNHQNPNKPIFGDATNIVSYTEAFNMVKNAEDAFMSLPAKVRKQFENDPAQFCDFAMNPENLRQMQEWGLAEKAPVGEQKSEPENTAQ